MIEYCRKDQPPAFFILLYYWFKIFPYNEWFARALAALIGVGGVMAMFYLGKEVQGTKAGLLASLLTALNWFHLYFSQEVRFYGLLFLITALSYLFFFKCLRLLKPLYLLAYIFSSLILLYTHYFGMVVLLTQLITFSWILSKRGFDKKLMGYGVLAGIVILIAFVPWMPVIIQDHSGPEYWIEMPGFDFLIIYYFIYLGHNNVLIILFALSALFYLVRVFGVENTAGSSTPARLHPKQYFMLLAIWIVLAYGIPLLYSISSRPILHERYTIIALPAILLVVALGFSYVKNLAVTLLLVGVIVASTAYNFTYTTHYYTATSKNQFREVVQAVLTKNKRKVNVYSDQAWHYNYYFRLYQAPYAAIDSYGIDFKEALKTEQQVWILQGLGTKGVSEEQQQYLGQHYQIAEEVKLVGASARLYERIGSQDQLLIVESTAGE